jgi:hypothetical protein
MAACGGDKDGEGPDPTQETGLTDTTPPAAPLEVFVGNDWYGTATRGSVEFPCEADLAYDAEADQVVGTMDIDALWDVVIVENEDGSFSGSGTPVFGDDTLDLSGLAVGDNGDMTGNWTWDYGNGVYEGTFTMSLGGPG